MPRRQVRSCLLRVHQRLKGSGGLGSRLLCKGDCHAYGTALWLLSRQPQPLCEAREGKQAVLQIHMKLNWTGSLLTSISHRTCLSLCHYVSLCLHCQLRLQPVSSVDQQTCETQQRDWAVTGRVQKNPFFLDS